MDQILEGLNGVTAIGGDMCVSGENNEGHDRNLIKLMEPAREEGLNIGQVSRWSWQTLSRLPNPINNDDVDLDLRVDGLALEADDPQHLTIALINFPTAKQQLLKDETLRDPILNGLREVIYRGWPENVKELTTDLRAYLSFRDELAVEAGVIFKDRQILVPKSMQKDILSQLHCGHQGVEKTRRLAHESVYWLKINRD